MTEKPNLIGCEIINKCQTKDGKNKVSLKLTFDNDEVEYRACIEGSLNYQIYMDIMDILKCVNDSEA